MIRFHYEKPEEKDWSGVPLAMVEKLYNKYKVHEISTRQLLTALNCRNVKQISSFLWRNRGRGPDYSDPGLVEGQMQIAMGNIGDGK